MSTYTMQPRIADLIYRLRSLSMGGAVLHIGAHPDDEDIGLLAYMAHKFGVRAVYWSATRGEGGQNRIGPYQAEALGVYRTWEAMAARIVDGGEALYGPFYDFGYSKNADEALTKWGRTDTVREIVRAIRLVQPQIIVARWTGTPIDFHGHHQAVGRAAIEAFEAAGDPEHFPELEAQGLAPWQPLKFYHSTNNSGGDFSSGGDANFSGRINDDLEQDGVLRINTGEFDPIAGMTYQEQAWLAYNNHKTQAMGLTPAPGDFFYYFSLRKSPVSKRETGFFDGLDPSLTGLADYPGEGSPILRTKLEHVKAKANDSIQKFQANDPMGASKPLLEGLSSLREIRAGLAKEGLDDNAQKAIDMYLARKIQDFEGVAAQCLGLNLECLTDHARVNPGQKFRITSRLWNHRGITIDEATFTLLVPDDWEVQSVEAKGSDKESNHPVAINDVTAPEMARLTCPYWLTHPRDRYRYRWPDSEPSVSPFSPSQVNVKCEVSRGEHQITLHKSAALRDSFPGGYRELTLSVVPPISLQPKNNHEFLQIKSSSQRLELQVAVHSNLEYASVEGRLELEVPTGWQVEPGHVDISLKKVGDVETARFTVTIPEDTPADNYLLLYVVRIGNRDYYANLNEVRMADPGLPGIPDKTNCIKEEFIIAPAEVNVHLLDVTFVQGQKYAYVEGASEEVLEALRRFNLDFHLIKDEDMDYIDLSQFDAVVIGPNAYLIRDALRKNAARFLEYVEQGGSLIVQYQGYEYQGKGFTPYPFHYNLPHDRVTYEDAPVTILNPDHFLFNSPNKITDRDFEGWIKDRGLYFFGRWDKRYETLLECNDPGEEPRKGGLLIASYGRGTYLYIGYSLFRQLSSGVPGAFRLFANILALPTARILIRAEFLKNVSLFSFMTEEQLQEVARIMSERWANDREYLCRQGDKASEMYIIVQGEVEIVKKIRSKEKVIRLAKQGEAIGEMAVLGKIPHVAAMRAKGNAHMLVIEAPHFRALTHQHSDISDRMIQILVNKLAEAES
jgi:LmbE family N-acetylglucosaminyl deacetylase